MTESGKRARSDVPVKYGFGRSRGDSQFAPKSGARFRTARLYLESEGSLPLFLSGPIGHHPSPAPQEFSEEPSKTISEAGFRGSGSRTSPVSSRVIASGIMAASAVAVVCVVFSLADRDRRTVIAHAGASLSAAQLEPIDQPTPSREAIAAAYKAALENRSRPDQPAPPR